MTENTDLPSARDEFETAVWQALRTLKAPFGTRPRHLIVDEILTAADTYATREPALRP